MKCDKCSASFMLSFENMMILENVTLFRCPECESCFSESELDENELEKLYWKESK